MCLCYILQIKKGWDLCSSGEECLPAAETIEHHHLWGGEFREVGITRDCKCQTPASSCQRRAFRRTLFEGTKYLVSVDVWKCVGPCSLKNNMCIPIRNSTLLIDTPNGEYSDSTDLTWLHHKPNGLCPKHLGKIRRSG